MPARILVCGDSHIPTRAREIPPLIRREFERSECDMILCTGDLVEIGVLRYLQSLSEVKVVRGNMDFLQLPDMVKVEVEGVKVGLFHGTGIYPRGDVRKLARVALNMGVGVSVHGHTHILSMDEVVVNGKMVLLLNPGSCTGVWGGGGGSSVPSFMILEIDRDIINVISYEQVGSKLNVGLQLSRNKYKFIST